MASSINASTSGAGGVITTADNTGILNLQTASTNAVTIDASQNVGIGTSSFSYSGSGRGLLELNGSTLSLFAMKYGNTPTFYALSSANDIELAAVGASTPMRFTVNSSERMRIDSSGKVFIGTTSITTGYAGANLIIGGNAAPMIKWQSTNGPKSWDAFIDSSGTNLYWAYNGTDKAYINASTGSWTTTSDLRAKKDITDITYGLNAVMELRPVSYLMNEDEDTSKKHLGFIAQEVKTVIDEAVDDVEEGKMYGFDKSGLVPVLVKAIQEQQTIINDLKARVTALEAK